MRTVAIVTALCLLAITGCGRKSQEKILEKTLENKASVNITEDGISIEGKDGKFSVSAGKSAKIPPSFPSDILVYEGAEVIMAMEVENGHQLQLRTDDARDKVVETYTKAMSAGNWKTERTWDSQHGKGFSLSKDGRMLTLSMVRQDASTYIAMVVMKPKEQAPESTEE